MVRSAFYLFILISIEKFHLVDKNRFRFQNWLSTCDEQDKSLEISVQALMWEFDPQWNKQTTNSLNHWLHQILIVRNVEEVMKNSNSGIESSFAAKTRGEFWDHVFPITLFQISIFGIVQWSQNKYFKWTKTLT